MSSGRVGERCYGRVFAAAGVLAGLLSAPAAGSAQNLTYSEFKFGVLAHDPSFLQGKEGGADINPELILASPVSDQWAATLPGYVRWMVQPRPTAGLEINTSGYTSQAYAGATWSWQLASDVAIPGDGVAISYFFGPGFNNGKIASRDPHRKSLGSNVLFREALELGYRINPVYTVSAFIDHVSDADLARYNQSLNDVGVRLGIRF